MPKSKKQKMLDIIRANAEKPGPRTEADYKREQEAIRQAAEELKELKANRQLRFF